MSIARAAFERVYRAQKDARVKERMLLVLNVVYHGKIAAHATREIHKSKGWASQWLKRYKKRTGRIDGHAKRLETSTGIQTGIMPDKDHFEGE